LYLTVYINYDEKLRCNLALLLKIATLIVEI
jgi:hypothetical protein